VRVIGVGFTLAVTVAVAVDVAMNFLNEGLHVL
jgi:hypothetical protein